jgi:hypothetical protein
MTPPKIRLWDGAGLGVIISSPTGVLYSNQTGGFSCLHPELEGAYIPLNTDAGEKLYAVRSGSTLAEIGALA